MEGDSRCHIPSCECFLSGESFLTALDTAVHVGTGCRQHWRASSTSITLAGSCGGPVSCAAGPWILDAALVAVGCSRCPRGDDRGPEGETQCATAGKIAKQAQGGKRTGIPAPVEVRRREAWRNFAVHHWCTDDRRLVGRVVAVPNTYARAGTIERATPVRFFRHDT